MPILENKINAEYHSSCKFTQRNFDFTSVIGSLTGISKFRNI